MKKPLVITTAVYRKLQDPRYSTGKFRLFKCRVVKRIINK
jgi:hypothetical protein